MSKLEKITYVPEFTAYHVLKRGESFSAEHDRDEQGINEAIEKKGIPVVHYKNWKLIEVPATTPHHPDHTKHRVFWMCKYEGDKLLNWTDVNEEKIPNQFIREIEDFIQLQQQFYSDLRAYSYSGYISQKRALSFAPGNPFNRKGLPTQKRKHFHLTHAIPPETKFHILDPYQEDERILIESILNYAGELTIQHFSNQLTHYGIQTNISVPFLNSSLVLHRTVFGFDSLQEAMKKTENLLTSRSHDWLTQTISLSDRYHNYVPEPLKIQQNLVPTAVTLLPSKIDRQLFSFPNMAVFTFPFSLGGAIQLLNGAVVRHYDESSE